jgi:hypothetical protein
MVVWGGLAGAVSIASGWAAGMALFDSDEGALLSAAALESFAIPYAVHHANGSRGELFLSLVTSYGVLTAAGAAFVAAGRGTESSVRAAFVVVPLTQLIASVLIEDRKR